MKRALFVFNALLLMAPACLAQGLPKLTQLPWDDTPHPILSLNDGYRQHVGMNTMLRYGRVDYISDAYEAVIGTGQLTFYGTWSSQPAAPSAKKERKHMVLILEGERLPDRARGEDTCDDLGTEREEQIIFQPRDIQPIKNCLEEIGRVASDLERFKVTPTGYRETLRYKSINGTTFALIRTEGGALHLFIENGTTGTSITLPLFEIPLIISDLSCIQSWLSQSKPKSRRIELPYNRIHGCILEWVPRNKS